MTQPDSKDQQKPLIEGAQALKKSLLTMVLNSMHILAKGGYIRIEETPFQNTQEGNNARIRNRRDYNSLSEDTRTGIFETTGKNLGLFDSTNLNKKFRFRPDTKTENTTTLAQYAIDVIIGQKSNALLFDLLQSEAIPPGTKGAILSAQINLLSELFTGINRTNSFVTDRIVGKALTVGTPKGGEFDILLSHYGYKS